MRPTSRITSCAVPDAQFVSHFTSPALPNLPKPPASIARKPLQRPPRSPLSPHKLAKIANALGVSTPLPASSPSASSASRSQLSVNTSDERSLSRSTTPGSAWRPASRYLVHVVPPSHFPHENEYDPDEYAAFRRGTLVPLHSTLQAQLSAISREFTIPNTHGMILYLMNDSDESDEESSIGPRIGDDVWKWIWAKAGEDQTVRGVGLGLSSGTSSPAPSKQMELVRKRSLPQLQTTTEKTGVAKATYPVIPLPSSPSSASASSKKQTTSTTSSPDPDSRTSSRQTENRSQQLAPETPATSALDLDPRLLPGLNSPSMIPVLAKVQFDIDRKVGTWYEKWSRSRREVYKRQRVARGITDEDEREIRERAANRAPQTSRKGKASPKPSLTPEPEEGDYAPLSDSPEDLDFHTARSTSRLDDPLAEVFGPDSATWSGIHTARPSISRREHDLALDGASLDAPNYNPDGASTSDTEKEVVSLWNAMDKPQFDPQPSPSANSRRPIPPPLNLGGTPRMQISAATSSPGDSNLPYLRSNTGGTDMSPQWDLSDDDNSARHISGEKREGGIYDDVELDLQVSQLTGSDFNFDDPDETRRSVIRMQEELDRIERNLAVLSPRDLKVNLDEDNMLYNLPLRSAPPGTTSFQLSPNSFPVGGAAHARSASSRNAPYGASLSPNARVGGSGGAPFVATIQQLRPVRPSMEVEEEVTVSPPSFKQPLLVGTPSPVASSFDSRSMQALSQGSAGSTPEAEGLSQAAWPAVPYAALVARGENVVSPKLASANLRTTPNSPPRLVLNGNSNGSRASQQSLRAVDPRASVSSESTARSMDEQSAAYPAKLSVTPSPVMKGDVPTESPIIPLSPDPFGRFSSAETIAALPTNASGTLRPERKSSLAAHVELGSGYGAEEMPPDNASVVSKPPSSRFSADSIIEERETPKPKDRGNLMSVKSIKKLWRKTNKASTSSVIPAPSNETAPTPPSRPPSAPASEFERDMSRNVSPAPPVPPLQTSQSMGSNGYASSSQKPVKPARRDSGLDPFYFDQDSKYPVRRSPSPQTVPFSRTNTPTTLPPLPTSAATIAAGAVPAPSPVEKKRTSRKSILRWKSGASASPPDRQAQLPGEESPEGRRRRPSMMDVAGSFIRGSISSASEPSPSVPEVPAMYRTSHQSRPSVTSPIAGEYRDQPVRQTSIRRKPVPSSTTSTDSQASTDPLRTPVSSSLSHGHGVLTSPRGSEETDGNLKIDSRFEVVAPKAS